MLPMPPDAMIALVTAAAALAGLAILVHATLVGWRGWLQLKQQQLALTGTPPAQGAGARIEIADLKERVRKLEAIAAGVDP